MKNKKAAEKKIEAAKKKIADKKAQKEEPQSLDQ